MRDEAFPGPRGKRGKHRDGGDAAWVEAVRGALLAHYDAHARDLPWRRETDPYRIWVSEVMLQQTRVETVVGYYRAWLARFPDLHVLADAPEESVLKAWEGLGYYRRARNLHAGARMVRDRFEGRLPETAEALRTLPGVGEYTAGAVASIAFGERVPAVDGNVRRVLSRLLDEAHPSPGWLRSTAALLVDPARPGDWNQALMELGATVCTPAAPRCAACPVEAFCAARDAGTQAERPAARPRAEVPAATFAVAVVRNADDRLLLIRRPPGGLLGGMWSFPERRVKGHAEDEVVAAAAAAAAAEAGVNVDRRHPPRTLAAVRHRFSHLDATYRPVLLSGRQGSGAPLEVAVEPAEGAARGVGAALGVDGDASAATGIHWADAGDLEAMALPVAQRKIARAAAAAAAG